MDQLTNLLQGRRILVVEDDYILALELVHGLESVGVEIVGPVGKVADAMARIAEGPRIDAAILDIHLGTEKVFPVAEALLARGVPFIFTTGYDISALPLNLAGIPLASKPVKVEDLMQRLVSEQDPNQ